jgi:hypothetical protein
MRSQFPSRKSSGFSESGEARVGPADIYLYPLRTPGATNQENVRETIRNQR